MTVGPLAFTAEESDRAHDAWGANCGPVALAAVTGLTLPIVRRFLGDFERKGYTNPTLMFRALDHIREDRFIASWTRKREPEWPRYGLVRIQWHGSWMNEGVPIPARYRQTHWVGAHYDERRHIDNRLAIFDVNAMHTGGWVPFPFWSQELVPMILKACVPHNDGHWSLTTCLEVHLRAPKGSVNHA